MLHHYTIKLQTPSYTLMYKQYGSLTYHRFRNFLRLTSPIFMGQELGGQIFYECSNCLNYSCWFGMMTRGNLGGLEGLTAVREPDVECKLSTSHKINFMVTCSLVWTIRKLYKAITIRLHVSLTQVFTSYGLQALCSPGHPELWPSSSCTFFFAAVYPP